MSSLADFGAETHPTLREIVKNDRGEVVCPVSQTPLDYSHGIIEIPVVRLVDDDLRDALEREDVATVRSRGYESPEELLLPETCSGRAAHGWSSKWVGVRAEFSARSRWIPVLGEDLPDHDLPTTAATTDADHDDPEPEPTTRVGHANADETAVYIGRGYDGEDFLDYLAGDLDAGERGWLGNPYPKEDFGRDECVRMFGVVLLDALEDDPDLRRELVERCRGRTLGCWCQRLDDDAPRCHGELIRDVVDRVLVASDGGETA